MSGESRKALDVRRAVEALRSGVPNRQAVRELGCNQPGAEHRFLTLLDQAGTGREEGRPEPQGMLVSGDFGAGKSHLLAYLEDLALSRDFVCSRVPVSTETPLYDLGKVFAAAMDNARMPKRRGRFVEELALAMDPRSERHADFARWTEQASADGVLSPIFPASLTVYEESDSGELKQEIEAFWAGDRLRIPSLRAGLRQIGKVRTYRFRAPKVTELPPQRLRFVLELIRAVGYRGLVVLLDEIELIGSYSILQRGRSYAEVARWTGRVHGQELPGLIVVGAVTDDFASAIISPDGQKKDRDYVRARLEKSARYHALGAHAESGMRVLERECLALDPPGDRDVQAVVEALRRLYREAYGWEPAPYAPAAGGAGFQGRMRYKVRAAINEWDLRRLHPGYRPETEIENFTTSYEENTALERQAGDDPT